MKFFFGLLVALTSNTLWAKSDGRDNLTLTPIIGFERIQKFQPTAHMKTRGIIGVGAVYKFPVVSAEAEFTHASDTSNDVTTNTSYKDEDDKIKLGLRGNADLGPYLSSYLRGGAQAKQSTQTRSVSGLASTTSKTTKVNPYVGTGLAIHLMQYLSISADVTAVYVPSSDPALSDYELQPSLGLTIRF